MYSEVKTFQDDEGRVITSRPSGDSVLLTGKHRVKTADMKEWDWEFAFPTEIQSLDEAFEKFDEIFKRRIDEHNSKFKK